MFKRLDDNIIEVLITPEMLAEAAEKAAEMGKLRNSIREGAGNIAGFLGECVSRVPFSGAVITNTYDHDFEWQGYTFDTKTKDRTVPPCLDFDASVAAYNTTQKADYYVFVSLLRNKQNEYSKGYIMGMYPSKDYKKESLFWPKGSIDPSNGWRVSVDCFNMPYRKLLQM